jgi:hypothetical protein
VVISDKKYYIDGINIESILNWDGTLGEDYWDYGPVKGFEYCANLYNCTYNNVSTGIWVDEYETYDAFTYIGFYGCFNLVNCFGKHKGNYSYSGMNSIFEFCEKFDTCEGVANDGTNVFTSCVNLNNCKGWCDNIWLEESSVSPFSYCKHLENCIGECVGLRDNYSRGFVFCEHLNNCIGKSSGAKNSENFAFEGCKFLTDCIGTGIGEKGVGFSDCHNLINCEGYGIGEGYDFSSSDPNSDFDSELAKDYGCGFGFEVCSNLTSCFGKGETLDSFNDSRIGNISAGFRDCRSLNNCTSESIKNQNNNGAAFGFYKCGGLYKCGDEYNNPDGMYYNCYPDPLKKMNEFPFSANMNYWESDEAWQEYHSAYTLELGWNLGPILSIKIVGP